MKFIKTTEATKLSIVRVETIPSSEIYHYALMHVNSNRIIGIPQKGIPIEPFFAEVGNSALADIIANGGFDPGTILYVFDAENIVDDIYRVIPSKISPSIQLDCCCCDKPFMGRQWPQQEQGTGLGDCCASQVNEQGHEFMNAYGIEGYNFNVAPTSGSSDVVA